MRFILPIFCLFFLSACGRRQAPAPSPTPTPKVVEIELEQKPSISLTPRQDGHELKLTIAEIPQIITSVEYELIYSAIDEDLIIEKGLAGTIEVDSTTISRDLLLGTASCTNGCKYKYDSGVDSGRLNLTFTTNTNQIALYQTEFILTDSSTIKKQGLTFQQLKVEATPSQNEFFIALIDYKQNYQIFSSGSGKAKINSISPEFTKQDKTIISGTYTK